MGVGLCRQNFDVASDQGGRLEQETHEKPSPSHAHLFPPPRGSGGILNVSAKFAYMESGSQPSSPCPAGSCMVREQDCYGMASGPFLCLDNPSGLPFPLHLYLCQGQPHLPGSWTCLLPARLCSGWLTKCRVRAAPYVRNKDEQICLSTMSEFIENSSQDTAFSVVTEFIENSSQDTAFFSNSVPDNPAFLIA